MPIKDKLKRQSYTRAYHKLWYERNKEKRRLQITQWKLANPDKVIEQRKRFREKRKNMTYYQAHREERLEYQKQYEQGVKYAPQPIAPIPVTEEDKWYDNIRLGILKGISTNLLPKEESDRWWNLLKQKVIAKYHSKFSDAQP